MAMHTSSSGGGPTPISGKTFLGHPVGLFLLFLVEMWERFSYYGMRGLLVLYLTAAIAAHQLVPGKYSNTLLIDQTPKVEEGQSTTTTRQRLPMSVAVGQAGGGKVAGVEGQGGSLVFTQLERSADPKKPGEYIWTPTSGAGLAGVEFTTEAGKRADGAPVKYRVTNPTDTPIKITLKIARPYPEATITKQIAEEKAHKASDDKRTDAEIEEEVRKRDDPDYKTYFKINDSTSVVSTTIPPDSARAADPAKQKEAQRPYEITIDYNRIDSGRSWIKANANTLYGWYTGMAYLLPILGGLIADKLLGTHRSMIVGGLLIALGHIVLGISGIGSMSLSDTGMSVFVMGLALITIGTGHFKPSVSVMVGQLYPLDDPRRESAYSIFYMGINLGSFLCNLACGYLAVAYGWHYGFAAAAVGMILGISIYMIFRSTYLPGIGESQTGKGSLAPLFFPVGILAAAGVAYLYHIGVLGLFDKFVSEPAVFYTILVGAVAYGVWFIAKQLPGDRGPVATIFIYMLFNAIFWLSFEQAGSSLNTFTDELTDRAFLGGDIPTAYFQSINPLLIIIFAPIAGVFWASLARKKKSIAQPFKIGTGLIFVGLGYLVMVAAALRLNSGLPKVGMMFITGCYFLHTVGEIILSPTGLSYVAKTAPKQHMSSLMGIWFISSFIAGLGAGKVAALVDPIIEGKVKLPPPFSLEGQASFFLLFVVTSCAAGVLILIIAPLLTRLQRNRQD